MKKAFEVQAVIVPDYVKILGIKQAVISITELDDEELRVLGREFTSNLIKRKYQILKENQNDK